MNNISELKRSMEATDAGDRYIELHDGDRWYPAREGQDVSRYIIAHALSNLCRFTGHCNGFYSVAEHSVKASYLVDAKFAYEALLHDAHECIVNDLSKPVKMFIGGTYQELEDKIETEVRTSFGLSNTISPEVKLADIQMVCIEGYYLMTSRGLEWEYYDEYREEALLRAKGMVYLQPHCWRPERAKDEFLRRFEELNNKRLGNEYL